MVFEDAIAAPLEVQAFRGTVVLFHPPTGSAAAITPDAAIESGMRLIEAGRKALAAEAPVLTFDSDD